MESHLRVQPPGRPHGAGGTWLLSLEVVVGYMGSDDDETHAGADE